MVDDTSEDYTAGYDAATDKWLTAAGKVYQNSAADTGHGKARRVAIRQVVEEVLGEMPQGDVRFLLGDDMATAYKESE